MITFGFKIKTDFKFTIFKKSYLTISIQFIYTKNLSIVHIKEERCVFTFNEQAKLMHGTLRVRHE